VADTASIKIVKTMPYRGSARLWSNRYHFTGGKPTTDAHWVTLADAVVASEKAIYLQPSDDVNDVQIVAAVGYDAGSDVPVWSKTYAQNGTGAFTNYGVVPGDVAMVGRYSTTQRTSKNHPIYLWNYWHGCHWAVGNNPDVLNAAQKTALEGYMSSWLSGFSDGDITHVRAGPHGAVAQSRLVLPDTRHRDFRN
jgi:hypothetical protein